MFETLRKNSRSTLQVFLGFLLGVVIDLVCFIFSIRLGFAVGLHQTWLYSAFNTLGLIGVEYGRVTHFRESSYTQAVVIARSLGLLLDAACGVFLH